MPGGYREREGEFAKGPQFARESGRDTSFLPSGQMFDRWISVNSTWAYALWFHQDDEPSAHDTAHAQTPHERMHAQFSSRRKKSTGTMRIEFVSGAICRYDNFPANDFLDLATSSSKGRYIANQIKKRNVPYTLERGPTRSAEQIKRLVAARKPVSAHQRRRFYNIAGKRNAGGGVPSR